ncbi:hypothetical protein ACFOWM_07880 [Ferruginibacter yonginensis]|uniref:Uncharacterized protein n=1 Tax=Ferruginibacter yonginensis TaxID=1310416 RepID=A0ABV8QRB1_9BACT
MKQIMQLLCTTIVLSITQLTTNAQTITYAKDKADLHEYLKITNINNKKINYEIYTESGGCSAFKRKGTANYVGNETEIDSDDNAFEVKQFVDKTKGCYVMIRMGDEKGYTNLAKFKVADCGTAATCKSESDLLKKQ